MARRTFDPNAEPRRPQDDARPQWSCAAHGCRLAGAVSTGASWWCGFHFGAAGPEIGRVSQVLAHNATVVDGLARIVTAFALPRIGWQHIDDAVAATEAEVYSAGYNVDEVLGLNRKPMQGRQVLAAIHSYLARQVVAVLREARAQRPLVTRDRSQGHAQAVADYLPGGAA